MMAQKRYLITTGIMEDSCFNGNEVFLGPWCLAGKKRDKFINLLVVPSPWRPAIKIKEAATFCRYVYEEVFTELTDQLNLFHGVSYPERYWMVLVGPWMVHFIEVLYDRYRRIENALVCFPDIAIQVLPRSLCKIHTADTYDFASSNGKMADDYYNLKLFSLITYHLFTDKVYERVLTLRPEEKKIVINDNFSKKLFFKIKEIRDSFCKPDIILSDMYISDIAQILFLEFKSGPNGIVFKNFYSVKSLPEGNNFSEELRNRLKFKVNKSDFGSLLRHMLPMALPLCYLENFKRYKEKVEMIDVKIVGSAVGWYFDERFKFFAAESGLKKSKLIDFQHGGGYGMYLSTPPEEISLEKDVFYTWGWNAENNKKTIPLVSPRLSKLKDTHKLKLNNILLVGNNNHKYLCRFASIFTPDDIPQYFTDKKRFFYSLKEEVRSSLLYRPYQEVGCCEVKEIKALIPGIRLLPEGNLTRWLKKVKLVAIDHLCTANLEALVINVPTIWFWDFNINLIRPEAKVYFEMLSEVGILHKSPEEAAKKVNEVFMDPLTWWNEPKVQKAKDIFCDRFAATSKNWCREWVNALSVSGDKDSVLMEEVCGIKGFTEKNITKIDNIIVQGLENKNGIWEGPSGGYWSNLDIEENKRYLKDLSVLGARKTVEQYFPQHSEVIFSPKRAAGLSLLDLKPGEIVLDVGCMWGALTVPLAKAGCNVIAIDQTLDSLLLLKQRLFDDKLTNVEIVRSDLKKIKYKESSIDKFVVNGVLEWIPEIGNIELKKYYGRKVHGKKYASDNPGHLQKEFLKNIYAGLKKNGKLFLAIENRFDIFYFLGLPDPHCNIKFITFLPRWMQDIISRAILRRPYVNWTYSRPALKKMLSEAGFKDISIFYAFPDYRYPEYILTDKGMNYYRPSLYRRGKGIGVKALCYAIEDIIFRRLKLKFFSPSLIIIAEK